uniref:Uncharacterized protein n=1 Tax=Setaria viridis TaxID=4556 RepID=A0A4U6W009_SETVI|nr:hypothetical protein SEVIR_2G391450v2 [Setaria viridis]
MPARGGAAMAMSVPATPTQSRPRRSGRLAKQTLNSTVRASKKGEVLVMRKLGLCSTDGPVPDQPHPQLASIFQRPLDAKYFCAIRDIFPATQALSDDDVRAVAVQLSGAISVC